LYLLLFRYLVPLVSRHRGFVLHPHGSLTELAENLVLLAE
jgi:hypothetical protein